MRPGNTRKYPILVPPPVEKHVRLWWHQWIGIPLLLLIPVLALFGVFGESLREVTASSEKIELTVIYPARFRYRQTQPLEILVRNKSPEAILDLIIELDPDYARHFSQVSFIPEANDAFKIRLLDLKPGEQRLIVGELEADNYGWHRGSVSAALPTPFPGVIVTRVKLNTIVFPW